MSSIGANTWQGTIPASLGKRVWYYVEAVDNKGNYSDNPSQATSTVFLAFTYDQTGTITPTFTASFVNPAGGDKHVSITGTATDQGGAVANAIVNYTIGLDSLTGSTNASGNFSVTSSTNFTSGDVPVTVTVTKAPSEQPGTCSKTLFGVLSSVTCP